MPQTAFIMNVFLMGTLKKSEYIGGGCFHYFFSFVNIRCLPCLFLPFFLVFKCIFVCGFDGLLLFDSQKRP